MLVIPQSPHQNHTDQRRDGRHTSARTAAARPELFVDERKHRRSETTEDEQPQHEWLNNEYDVPRIPFLRKWPEWPNSVVVGEIEENVTEPGKAGIEKEHAPTRRQFRIVRLSAAQPPHQINKTNYNHGNNRNSQERMREPAMMLETKCPSPETANDIEVRRFGRQSQRERRKRRFAIEPSAPQARAGQKVSDRFQAVI